MYNETQRRWENYEDALAAIEAQEQPSNLLNDIFDDDGGDGGEEEGEASDATRPDAVEIARDVDGDGEPDNSGVVAGFQGVRYDAERDVYLSRAGTEYNTAAGAERGNLLDAGQAVAAPEDYVPVYQREFDLSQSELDLFDAVASLRAQEWEEEEIALQLWQAGYSREIIAAALQGQILRRAGLADRLTTDYDPVLRQVHFTTDDRAGTWSRDPTTGLTQNMGLRFGAPLYDGLGQPVQMSTARSIAFSLQHGTDGLQPEDVAALERTLGEDREAWKRWADNYLAGGRLPEAQQRPPEEGAVYLDQEAASELRLTPGWYKGEDVQGKEYVDAEEAEKLGIEAGVYDSKSMDALRDRRATQTYLSVEDAQSLGLRPGFYDELGLEEYKARRAEEDAFNAELREQGEEPIDPAWQAHLDAEYEKLFVTTPSGARYNREDLLNAGIDPDSDPSTLDAAIVAQERIGNIVQQAQQNVFDRTYVRTSSGAVYEREALLDAGIDPDSDPSTLDAAIVAQGRVDQIAQQAQWNIYQRDVDEALTDLARGGTIVPRPIAETARGGDPQPLMDFIAQQQEQFRDDHIQLPNGLWVPRSELQPGETIDHRTGQVITPPPPPQSRGIFDGVSPEARTLFAGGDAPPTDVSSESGARTYNDAARAWE
ncbi:MAG: hypothetical protein F4X54_07740, partial [Chloroflexi bacterium]|nr:hypothetical protein [Chloroflexota bacterium]